MSSPTPSLTYAPYQSHRRAASSASISNATPLPGPLQSHSSANDRQQPRSIAVPADPAASNTNATPTPASVIVRPAPTPAKLSRGASGGPPAPPPLRSVASLRSGKAATARSPLATGSTTRAPTSSAKGKERESSDVSATEATHTRTSPSSAATAHISPTRRSVSSALTVPSSTSVGEHRGNGHAKRSSVSPSPTSSNPSGHSRSLSGNASLPVNLPHLMSTAQRLRTVSPLGQTSSPHNSSPTHTPAASPGLNASFGNMALPQQLSSLPGPNGSMHPGDGIGRSTTYRPGFQPKGMYRVRTDEFVAARARRKLGIRCEEGFENGAGSEATETRSELESQRLERRLEKVLALHYGNSPIFSEEDALGVAPSWLPGTIRKARLQAELERRLREEEMRIVKWEDDKSRKACAICSTPFSFTVRKHHCRLCGRIVCASPHLSLAPGLDGLAVRAAAQSAEKGSAESAVAEEVKCSGLVTSDGKGGAKIKDVPRWDEAARQGLDADGRTRGIRMCRTCKETIGHRQYMLDDGSVPAYLKLYEALRALQREIEQSLPEFQEMVLGLQKHDAAAALGTGSGEGEEEGRDPLLSPQHDNLQTLAAQKAKNRTTLALQRDAAQARKQLLANFANYDLIAKKIRNLDDQGNVSLARLKIAVWTQANVFLQSNMFPLQNLPKLTSSSNKKDSPKTSGSSTPTLGTQASGTASGGQDPTSVRESIAVLEEQLGRVRQYAASASRARQLQDAGSLQASARDLEAEIGRLERLLPAGSALQAG